MADDEDLDRRARELGGRWQADLEGEPEGVRQAFAFLATMALVKAGAYHLVFRGEREGRRVVIASLPYTEQIFEVLDPEYGEAEDAAVAAMMGVLGLQ